MRQSVADDEHTCNSSTVKALIRSCGKFKASFPNATLPSSTGPA